MKKILAKTPTNNATLKIMAFILGYASWSIISSQFATQRWVEIPLCFFATSPDIVLEAPESVSVAIYGSRTDIANLDTTQLAIHIDSQTLTPGKNLLNVENKQLLLPRTLTVTHWSPSNVVVSVKQQHLADERAT